MIKRIWAYLRQHNLLVFFVAVYAVAWTSNALYGTKFVMKEWEELGKYILGKYFTDSTLNSQIPAINQIRGCGERERNDSRHD